MGLNSFHSLGVVDIIKDFSLIGFPLMVSSLDKTYFI